MDSFYRATISEEQLSNAEIKQWIESLLEMKCANVILDDGESNDIVSLKPELVIRDTIDYYRLNHEISNDVGIMNNLHHLTIHLNGSSYGNDMYAKQVIFPIKKCDILDYSKISHFIYSFGRPDFLVGISLVGCIWQYANYSQLFSFLKNINIRPTIYSTEKDFHENIDLVKRQIETDDLSLHVIFSDYEYTEDFFLESGSIISNINYDFIVSSEDEYKNVESLVSHYKIDQYSILPIYNGKNISFFEDNIYTTEEDMMSLKLSKREVFAHQVINTHFFGRLTIHPNGEVFADTTKSAIGNISEDLYSLVSREIMTGNAWFRIRNQEPCCNCIYQFLCPSPSYYEAVIDKSNLCHLFVNTR